MKRSPVVIETVTKEVVVTPMTTKMKKMQFGRKSTVENLILGRGSIIAQNIFWGIHWNDVQGKDGRVEGLVKTGFLDIQELLPVLNRDAMASMGSHDK
ncbi:hypothetical protein L195_g040701 [Trifolium pratense]|uniref:Uncharacterized protein n=1 Tax=Trifolium pratense TaxID=57577 RepID=A0A2K3M1H1_TRIPR|nr:hypothetical protein L195_g040701 [Trifolium pratense]